MPACEIQQFLKELLLKDLLKNVPAEYDKGKNLYDELKLLSRFDPKQWKTKTFLSCHDTRHFSKYKEYLNRLEGEVRLGFKHWDTEGPFFNILEVLEAPPTSIIVRDDLVQTLANLFFEIIRLSNEILLNGSEHPSFWINFKTYKKFVEMVTTLDVMKEFLREQDDQQRFFDLLNLKLELHDMEPITRRDFVALEMRYAQPSFQYNVSLDLVGILIGAIMFGFRNGDRENFKKELQELFGNMNSAFCSNHEIEIGILFQLLKGTEFSGFLDSIKVLDPQTHTGICKILTGMAMSVRSVSTFRSDGINFFQTRTYPQTLAKYLSDEFQPKIHEIVVWVCAKLKIPVPGQVPDQEESVLDLFEA